MSNERRTLLFKLNRRGGVQEFEVIAREIEAGAVLITRKGIVGGAIQEDIEPQYPKNVGRANETTPWQQALIMADSKVSKLGDKGYKVYPDYPPMKQLIEELEALEGTDINGNLIPMRAKAEMKLIEECLEEYGYGYLQRKFDGVRAVTRKDSTHHDIRSRNGKFWEYLDHILEDLPNLPDGWQYDGEMYHHDRSLQQIVSMVKREQEANKEIQYRVYDLMGTGLPYKERKKRLARILRFRGDSIKKVKTYKVHSMEEVTELFSQFKAEGYEGAMFRTPEDLYDPGGFRSNFLIKVKDFLEEEFEIIGVEEATGRDEGTAIFVCKTDDGQEFNVRPMGTRELRKDYLENFEEKYLGKMLTVRFQQWTDDGKPFHHRGVIIRDYE
jgi:DNA ligase-1